MSDTMIAPEKVERATLDEETRDVLRRAKELLVNHGWCRGPGGMPYDPGHTGKFCVAGAIHAVGAREDSYTYAAELLGFVSTTAVWKWNDSPERTQAEVVALFDEALTA